MEKNEKDEKKNENSLENLIQMEFYDLKDEKMEKYNLNNILDESLTTINNIKLLLKEDKQDDSNDSTQIDINDQSEINEKDEKLNNINNNYNSTSEESNKIPKKFLINPIDFVDYLECEQPKKKMEKIKKEFILRKYEETNQTKFEVSHINKDVELNKAIFPQNEIITAIYFYDENIVTGNIYGQVKIFSMSDKKQLKLFSLLGELETNPYVTCIDISTDKRQILVGYTNGNIGFFEINSQKLKLLINDIINNCECLCIKFISREGKFIHIIATDQVGNIFLINIKDGMTGCRVIEKKTISKNKDYPIYFIKPIEFNEKFLKRYAFLKSLKKYIIFGSLKGIEIYSNESNNIKLKIDIPNKEDYMVQDVCFGVGRHPQNRESQEEDEDEPQILVIVSCSNILYLYIIPIDSGELTNKVLIGHYLNYNKYGNNEIVRIGFLSKGTIFLIDKNNYLKILNTRKFIKGPPDLDEVTLDPIKEVNYDLAEIQEIYKFELKIDKQINLITPDSRYKFTYVNSIFQNFDNLKVAISAKNCIYILELINYEDCLRTLQQKEKMIEMLLLGIKIYNGQISCLEGIPGNVEERKKKLRDYLQQLISVYIIADDMSQKNQKNTYYDNQENLKHLNNKIEIIIEFCSEIEGFDFLLDKILNMYEAKGYGDLFLSKLEYFILCDKMNNYEISEDLILKLIQLYEEKNKTDILNKLLLHIDIKSLCSPSVNSKIIELSLLPPMINIFVNGNNPNYFTPIIKLYEVYQKAKALNFNSYEKILEIKQLSEIIDSKEYKGHKLFWYIKKCLIKKKYPYFLDNMEEKEYSKFMMDLIFWLMKDSTMKDLIEFESEIYFDILYKIFDEQNNINIINNYNSDSDQVKKKLRNLNEQSYNYEYKDLSPTNLINYIVNQDKKIKGSKKMSLDFNLFVVQIYKKFQLSKEVIINSIIHIISDYSNVNKVIIEKKINKLIVIIINILNNNIFTEPDFKNILEHFNDEHIFDEIKVFIFEKTNQYQKCLELYINKECKINNKEDNIFNFINRIFAKLNEDEKNEDIFLNFKNLVLKNMLSIGEISEKNMLQIINNWFHENKNDKKQLIEILSKNPKIQFLYVEALSEEYIEGTNEDDNNIIKDDKDFITDTLGLYIQLLCITDKKDKILKKLRQSILYPVKSCINICEEHNVKDALIYLYQLKGDFQNALRLSLSIINENFQSILDIITSDIFKNKEFDEKIENFNKSINLNIEILEKIQSLNSDKNDDSNEMGYLWFQLLDKLYDISVSYDKKFGKLSKNRKIFGILFEGALSDNIRDVLEKMSIYIGVNRIIKIVSQKNKTAGYKEFKPLLLKIFETYDNQSFILNSVGRLLINLCFENIHQYKKIFLGGKSVNLLKCEICGINFNQNQKNESKKILIFRCEHIMHWSCSFSEIVDDEQVQVCPICRKDEIRNAVSSLSLPHKGKIRENKIIEHEKKKKFNKYKIDMTIYKKGVNRIKYYDKNYDFKNKNFIDDCAFACRSDYKGN